MASSFEAACYLSAQVATVENFRVFGVPFTMRCRRELLREIGWTSEGLVQEARRRMHARLEEA